MSDGWRVANGGWRGVAWRGKWSAGVLAGHHQHAKRHFPAGGEEA